MKRLLKNVKIIKFFVFGYREPSGFVSKTVLNKVQEINMVTTESAPKVDDSSIMERAPTIECVTNYTNVVDCSPGCCTPQD